MLLLAIGVIFFVILYQRRIIAHQQELKEINEQKETELIQAAIQSEEDERNRIATELHDDVAATLASARLFLYKGKDVPFDDEKISQSKELLDESIKKDTGNFAQAAAFAVAAFGAAIGITIIGRNTEQLRQYRCKVYG